MLNRFLVAMVAVGASGLIGCVDPRGSFEDFSDRTGITDASTVDRASGTIADVDGTFLFGMRVGSFGSDPSLYIQFLVTFDITMTGETAKLDASYTPLCVNASLCTERSQLPPPLTDLQRDVNADGTFQQALTGNVAGGANPASGSPIMPITALLDATIMSADLLCGTVSGTAIIDLMGSTFAAIRVTDTTPANLPAPQVACPSSMPTDAGVDAPVDAPIDAAVDAVEIDAMI